MMWNIIIDGIRLDRDQARQIIDEAVEETRKEDWVRGATGLALLILVILVVVIASGWFSAILIRYFTGGSLSAWIWVIATSIMTGVIVGLAYHPLMRPLHRREIRRAMIRHGFERFHNG